jgi:hypothetical protein
MSGKRPSESHVEIRKRMLIACLEDIIEELKYGIPLERRTERFVSTEYGISDSEFKGRTSKLKSIYK